MMGDREVGKRSRGEKAGEKAGDKERVEVKRRKEEKKERTEGERKITFCRVREKLRERER